jgi:hypothetical protein
MKSLVTPIIAAVMTAASVWFAGCGTAPPELEQASYGMTGDTVIKDEAALRKLLGDHLFSLQWISWEDFGTATVTEKNGRLFLEARQESEDGEDYVTVEGVVTEVNSRYFQMQGEIVTRVSFINEGEPCERTGTFTFGINFNRKYWRLQEMTNPCEGGNHVDYIDIYFARP